MKNKKGFTLAELLVVVAIIAVLVAIAIPVFSSQLEKAREATDLANIRSAYAEVATAVVTGDKNVDKSKSLGRLDTYYSLKDNPNVYFNDEGNFYQYIAAIEITQKQNGWQTENVEESIVSLFGERDGEDFNWRINNSLEEHIEEYGDDNAIYIVGYEIDTNSINPHPWYIELNNLYN